MSATPLSNAEIAELLGASPRTGPAPSPERLLATLAEVPRLRALCRELDGRPSTTTTVEKLVVPSDAYAIRGARIAGDTELAVRVTAPEFKHGSVWVPKSAVHDDSEVYQRDDFGTMFVLLWFAEKQGWC